MGGSGFNREKKPNSLTSPSPKLFPKKVFPLSSPFHISFELTTTRCTTRLFLLSLSLFSSSLPPAVVDSDGGGKKSREKKPFHFRQRGSKREERSKGGRYFTFPFPPPSLRPNERQMATPAVLKAPHAHRRNRCFPKLF